MEKNRIRPIKTGKSFRMSYSRQQVLECLTSLKFRKKIPISGFLTKD